MSRHRLFYIVCRLVIPLWLLAGAIVKLVERNPKLLPPPVLAVVQFFDGWFGASGGAWFDLSMRLIVVGEFALVAVMLCMPRLARAVAVATLSLFCVILLSVIVPAFLDKGWEGAWKGSCGCFGSGGPNPLIMLAIDLTLLVLALISKPRVARPVPLPSTFGLPAAVALTVIWSSLVVFVVPERSKIEIVVPNPAPPLGAPAPVNPENPTVIPVVVAPVANPWTGLPATAAPYYVPDFSTWRGTRLDAQELARLMTPAPPTTINSGTWMVMLYREDCDHCHEILQKYFSGPLATPTLTIAIPDTDPAASQEMPCSECQIRKLLKGPDYVLTTPVLMRLDDGVITDIVTDSEDHAAIERC
ncbi:MAG: hypothetical protein EXS17_01200, partial [Phycisphaerales bacterium]|nr:hypothetical protein [Phycisphaerales bacterium]